MPRSKETTNSDRQRRESVNKSASLMKINGWRIGFHAQILLKLEKLIEAVEEERRRHPGRVPQSQPARILASLRQLIFVDIPADPTRSIYRQGDTLGRDRKHWFRAKFGNGRYRLFFRYRASDKVLLFAWVNDEGTLRTYGKSTDAYAAFASMLDRDDPPDDWDALLTACATPEMVQRWNQIMDRLIPKDVDL